LFAISLGQGVRTQDLKEKAPAFILRRQGLWG